MAALKNNMKIKNKLYIFFYIFCAYLPQLLAQSYPYHQEILLTPSSQLKNCTSHYFEKNSNLNIIQYTPHSYSIPLNLHYERCKHWNKEQFLEYLSYLQRNNPLHPEEILSLHHLYTCNGFIESIKTLAQYKPYILRLAKKFIAKNLLSFYIGLRGLEKQFTNLKKKLLDKKMKQDYVNNVKKRKKKTAKKKLNHLLQNNSTNKIRI